MQVLEISVVEVITLFLLRLEVVHKYDILSLNGFHWLLTILVVHYGDSGGIWNRFLNIILPWKRSIPILAMLYVRDEDLVDFSLVSRSKLQFVLCQTEMKYLDNKMKISNPYPRVEKNWATTLLIQTLELQIVQPNSQSSSRYQWSVEKNLSNNTKKNAEDLALYYILSSSAK